MHGDLGLHVLRHAAQEPKLAQDQRTEQNSMVVVALDPRMILLIAIHNAAPKHMAHIVIQMAIVSRTCAMTVCTIVSAVAN